MVSSEAQAMAESVTACGLAGITVPGASANFRAMLLFLPAFRAGPETAKRLTLKEFRIRRFSWKRTLTSAETPPGWERLTRDPTVVDRSHHLKHLLFFRRVMEPPPKNRNTRSLPLPDG